MSTPFDPPLLPLCHLTPVLCYVSHVRCQMSHVRCQVSHVTSKSQTVTSPTCHMSYVICPISHVKCHIVTYHMLLIFTIIFFMLKLFVGEYFIWARRRVTQERGKIRLSCLTVVMVRLQPELVPTDGSHLN